MQRWQSRGDLLRWWRSEVADISQRQLAERLGVARTAVTNWEGNSRIASIDIDRIDAALGADGVLAGWLWSFETPAGLPARRIWSSVYPGESTPVWVWIRSEELHLDIEAEWGMYRFAGQFELGPNGMVVTVGVSIEGPPAIVQLSTPGWVDFGRGELPDGLPGLLVVDVMEQFGPGSAADDFTQLLSNDILRRFDGSTPPEIADLSDESRRPMESFVRRLDGTEAEAPDEQPEQRGRPWPMLREGAGAESRADYARLREARQLSLTETAHRLAVVTGIKAGKDTLRRFESDVGTPHDRLFTAALDHVLGANGYLANGPIAKGCGTKRVSIPEYWQAPVWIEFRELDDESGGRSDTPTRTASRVAELQWGSWRRRIDGELPLRIISHAPPAPLTIVAEPGVCWTAGVGRPPDAIPVNHWWVPDSLDTTNEAISTYEDVLFDALRHFSEHSRHPSDEPEADDDGQPGSGPDDGSVGGGAAPDR